MDELERIRRLLRRHQTNPDIIAAFDVYRFDLLGIYQQDDPDMSKEDLDARFVSRIDGGWHNAIVSNESFARREPRCMLLVNMMMRKPKHDYSEIMATSFVDDWRRHFWRRRQKIMSVHKWFYEEGWSEFATETEYLLYELGVWHDYKPGKTFRVFRYEKGEQIYYKLQTTGSLWDRFIGLFWKPLVPKTTDTM